MNILIVGAHPDDYELGMAGTIKKHIVEGHNIISIIMSNGEAIGNANERAKEAKKSAKFLGIKTSLMRINICLAAFGTVSGFHRASIKMNCGNCT